MSGSCRCVRSHRRWARRRTCGLPYPREVGTPRSCPTACYRYAKPWLCETSNSRGAKEDGSTWMDGRSLALAVGSQALSHHEHIVQAGNDGEKESRSEKRQPGNRHPGQRMHQQQHHEKHSRYLGEGIGLAKNTGTKIPQTSSNVEHGANRHDADVPRENQHSELPGDFV